MYANLILTFLLGVRISWRDIRSTCRFDLYDYMRDVSNGDIYRFSRTKQYTTAHKSMMTSLSTTVDSDNMHSGLVVELRLCYLDL